ncbi:MAG: MerR family transcriptional regulator, partial [Gemmatimonadaceae bacterium]
RTVRHHIQQGLLPSPQSRGPGAHYTPDYLDRLRLIKQLQREHLPLSEIRRRLEGLSPEEVRQLAEKPRERTTGDARQYIRRVLSEGAHRLSEESALLRTLRPMESPMVPYMGLQRAKGERSQWDRFTLAPDMELHVRRPLSREQNRQVERLLEAARDILEEDVP